MERWKKIASILFLGSAVSEVLSSLLRKELEWLGGILTFGLFLGSLTGWHLVFKNGKCLRSIFRQTMALVLLFSLSMLAQWSVYLVATAHWTGFELTIRETMAVINVFSAIGVTGFSYALWRMFMIQRIRILRPVFFALAFLFSSYILYIYMPQYEETLKYTSVNPLPSTFQDLVFDHLFWCMTALWLVLLFTLSFGRSYLQREYHWKEREDVRW